MSKPRGFYVLDRRLFARPMVVHPRDGNRDVPEGGILLFALPGEPGTEFEDRDAAEAAIERTLAHSAAYRYGWTPEDYSICRARDYVETAKAIRSEKRQAARDAAAAESPGEGGAS